MKKREESGKENKGKTTSQGLGKILSCMERIQEVSSAPKACVVLVLTGARNRNS
jgi:hypothetical protein